ncbi:imidazole glycerol phosphate synthase subunit HisH [Gammaproteobacteria bacterium]|jgi:glutamine amidotransferase|nr:imidazole glycerol phosphate synthase subunit HisH [Gammaproteobacteria bacterium]MDB2678365.1 imidazole glycerol phosphate synthase subunit HisH [Gammaproteobacteria bacterium]
MKKISIVDYGLGNLFSVYQALEYCDSNAYKIQITSCQKKIKESDYLILPGVGAFKNAMHEIENKHLIESIKDFANTGKPLLGICLGMQIFASISEEFGSHVGLDLISGRVSHIGENNLDGSIRKVPSIGWKNIKLSGSLADKSVLANHDESSVYFVHSYHFITSKSEHTIATYEHGDSKITAAVQMGNILGCQFHPEKSGSNGLEIINKFLRL